MSTLAEKIEKYRIELGFKSISALAKEAGIPASTLFEVLSGRTETLSAKNSQKLAACVGVSVDELYGEKEKAPDAEAPREKRNDEFIEIFESLPEEKQKAVLDYLRYVAGK